MTEPDGTFEEEIRRALRTAGDLVVPAGDGLNKIRERTVYRQRPLAWLFASTAHLLSLPLVWLRVPASELAATARGHSGLMPRLRSARRWPASLAPRLRSARRWPGIVLGTLRSPAGWLRPVLAATAALILVLAVALAVPRLRESVGAELSGGLTSSSGPGNNGGPGALNGFGSAQSNGAVPFATGAVSPMPGQPWDATILPAGMSTTCQSGSSSRQPAPLSPLAPIPPSPAPGPSQTLTAGQLAQLSPASQALVSHANVAGLGQVGPLGAATHTVSCSRTPHPATSAPFTPIPATSPAWTPSPTTSPTTTPTTTTSPTTTPTTTTSPTTSPTSTPSTTASSLSPSGTAGPG